MVLDRCRDDTGRVATDSAAAHGVSITVVSSPGLGAGSARGAGMDLACTRLLAVGKRGRLIACTDADTRPGPEWLERQLMHLAAGARAIAGRIELDPWEAAQLPDGVLQRRAREAATRLERVRRREPAAHPPSLRRGIAGRVRRDLPRGRWTAAAARARGCRVRRAARRSRRPDHPAHRRRGDHLRAAGRPRPAGPVGRPGARRLVRWPPADRRVHARPTGRRQGRHAGHGDRPGEGVRGHDRRRARAHGRARRRPWAGGRSRRRRRRLPRWQRPDRTVSRRAGDPAGSGRVAARSGAGQGRTRCGGRCS